MYEKVMQSVEYINSKVNIEPDVAVILGSGLGQLVDSIEKPTYIKYTDIPNFPQSTVVGHEGQLVFGNIKGVNVLAMQGRFHYYEGYSMKEVTYPVYVMKQLGIENLIITNSCGGINTSFAPGTLMLITDFINFVSDNPLYGPNDERFGPRFPDMTEPYDLELQKRAKSVAMELGISHGEGVYGGFIGPCYETAAEIRAFGKLGADAIGMSTVPETIAANYLGMKVLGISCITNMATGIQQQKHSHANVVAIAKKASLDFCKWVGGVIEDFGREDN
ncbi:MAG: purine-nucleoside phosphorylase [Vallitalea sp.]|nr:purine-nucleoside phosphorylase [Vallitalea sp.]MCT4686132.1 purine-nucleoside phosphorylase [Vallitalea sp.]